MNFLFEIFGENNTGKTHQAHDNWPEPYHVDTAFTSMGFRELEVDPDTERQGESWPVVLELHDWDETEARKHYHYAAEYDDLWDAIGRADAAGAETIVFDNSHDMRVLAAKHWCEENDTDWPQQQQWGEVNDLVDQVFQRALEDRHVVVISQMTDEYRDGDKTGERVWDGPKRMPFKADFRLKLEVDGSTRVCRVIKNGSVDQAGDDWIPAIGDEADFETLLLASDVPEDQW